MALAKIGALPEDWSTEPDNLNTKYTNTQIKALLNSNPGAIKTFLDSLIDILNSTVDGSSGADNIASPTIAGVTGNTVKAQLVSLKALINATALGQIPDGSLTTAKYADGSVTAAKVAPDVAKTSDVTTVTNNLNTHLAENAQQAHNGINAGTNNKDTQEVKNLLIDTDTRSVNITRTFGLISSVTLTDPTDSSTVETVTITRTSGAISSVQKVVGSRTITYTVNRTSGQISSITKAVV